MNTSNRLPLEDIRKVFRLLMQCRDLRGDPATCQGHMVTGLCDLVGARQGVAVHFRGFTPTDSVAVTECVMGGWPDPAESAFWVQWGSKGSFKEDPLVNVSAQHPGSVVAAIRREFVTDKSWHTSHFYQECVEPARIRDVMIAFFRCHDPGSAVGFSLHRTRGERPFRIRQRKILQFFNEEYQRLYLDGMFGNLEADLVAALPGHLRKVCHQLLDGTRSIKLIAIDLKLRLQSVRTYTKQVYRRLGVSSRVELIAKYGYGK